MTTWKRNQKGQSFVPGNTVTFMSPSPCIHTMPVQYLSQENGQTSTLECMKNDRVWQQGSVSHYTTLELLNSVSARGVISRNYWLYLPPELGYLSFTKLSIFSWRQKHNYINPLEVSSRNIDSSQKHFACIFLNLPFCKQVQNHDYSRGG